MNMRIGIAIGLAALLGLGLATYLTKNATVDTETSVSEGAAKDSVPKDTAPRAEERSVAPPPSTEAPTTVRSQDGDAVFGIVTDAITGEAVGAARVRVQWEEVETTTDDDGSYRLAMEEGSDAIVVEASGYAREVVDISNAHVGRVDVQLFAGGMIAGTVVDNDTGEGIEGVKAIAMPIQTDTWEFALSAQDAANVYGQTTNESGRFTITSIPEGEFMVGVQVNETGYLYDGTQTQSIQVTARKESAANFRLERGAEIRGRVVNANGEPIAGVEMSIGGNQVSNAYKLTEMGLDPNYLNDRAATTDDNGHYSMLGAKRGEVMTVFAEAAGFAKTQSDRFEIPSEGYATAPDIILHPGQTISGIAQYDDGANIEDGSVFLNSDDPSLAWYMERGDVDEDGRFTLRDVPVGTYSLRLLHFSGDFPGTEPEDPSLSVVVKPGEDLSGIVLTAQRPTTSPTSIFGTVLDAQGNPVEGARVTAKTMINFEEEDWEDTDEDGHFSVVTQGLSARVEARYEGKMAFADDVQAGSDIRLVLGEASSIAGVIVDATGAPCVRCSVILETIAGDESPSPMAGMFAAMGGMLGDRGGIKTDVDGYFRFGDLTPGTYKAIASGQNAGHGESQQIELLPGEQKTGVRITLAPGASVTGRVRDSGGALVSGVSVALTQGGDNDFAGIMGNMMPMGMSGGPRAITNGDGEYTIDNVAPGVYSAVATHPKYSKTSSELFELDSGQQLNSMDIVLNNGGTVRGVLVTDGEVKPHTMITMVGTQGVFTVMTDSEGGFEVGQMPPGRYIAQHVDMGAMMGGDLSAMSQTPTIVEVADGETTEVDFRPPENAVTMSGVVHGASGMTTISLRREDSPDISQLDPMSMDMELMLQMAEYQVGQAIARPDGTFSLQGVPPGNYIADIVSINFDMSAGLAAFENFDPSDMPTRSVPITVTEEGAYFEFNMNELDEDVAPAP